MESFTLAGEYSYGGRKFSRPVVTVSEKGVTRDEVEGGVLCNANSIKGRISFFFVACCRLYIIFSMYRYIIIRIPTTEPFSRRADLNLFATSSK